MGFTKYILLFLFSILFLGVTVNAQTQYHPKTIVLKLQADKKHLAANDGITHPHVAAYIASLNPYAYERLFPNHTTPSNAMDEYGNKLVDISLIYQFKYTENVSEELVVQKLQDMDIFEYVCLRPYSELLYMPDDSLIGHQYHLPLISAFAAWDVETGDSTVIVGITDTGTDRGHEDLENIAYNYADTIDGIDNDNDGFIDNHYGWDIGSNDNNPQWSPVGHGVFTTGMSSATVDNGRGIAGTGYHCSYLPVKVDDSTGSLVRDYEGIVYAADHNCAIINCSWGGSLGSPFGQDIVNYATFNRNSLVVAAGGNSYNENWIYPASYDNVFSVAATNSEDKKWTNSSWGTRIDISAPGASVYSSWPGDIYFASSGTSFSAPQVAGAAALIKSKYPSLTALQLGEQLRVNCDVIDTIADNVPYANQLGAGRLNMYKALTDTNKASVRLRNTEYTVVGDTLYIESEFVNYLRTTSSSAYAVLRSKSPYLSVTDSMMPLPLLGELAFVNNQNTPYKVLIDNSIPEGYLYDIEVHFVDTNTTGLEYIRLKLNHDYLQLDTNLISTTIGPTGKLGYRTSAYAQGDGFRLNGGNYMFGMSGLVIGRSMSQVSDDLYGVSTYDTDFSSQGKAQYITPNQLGHQQVNASFTDAGAGTNAMNVLVKEKAYAFDSLALSNVIFLDFTIINQGFSVISDFYVGYYIDWDIANSSKNRALYDTVLQFAYTWPTEGGDYGGIQAIDGFQAKAHQFNLNGSNGSVYLYDGFEEHEKFTVLSTRRDSAGFANNLGTDVGSMVSYGPYTLAVGDSTHVVFAVIAGNHLLDVMNAADAAKNYYYFDDTPIDDRTALEQFDVYPNPAHDVIVLDFASNTQQAIEIRIKDMHGKTIATYEELSFKQGKNQHQIPVVELEDGVYLVEIISAAGISTRKFVKVSL